MPASSTWATDLGATHTIDGSKVDDVVTAIQDLTDGNGAADVVIDAVGRPETYKTAFYARDLAGVVVLVGVPTPEMTLELPLIDFFSRGGASSRPGTAILPERDFPMLVDLYQQGRLPLEKFVSEQVGLDDVEAAFHKIGRRSAAFGGDLVTIRIENVVTSGQFSLDGGTWDVDNNIWLIGDDSEVVIIDAAHSATPIIDAVAGRTVKAVLLTHGHNDHVTVAPELSQRLDAPMLLHPGDRMLWDQTHPDIGPGELEDGQKITVGGTDLVVINTQDLRPARARSTPRTRRVVQR